MGFGAGLAPDRKQLIIANLDQATQLGKRLAFQVGDTFVSMNDQPFNLETYQACFGQYIASAKVGDKVKFVVKRKNAEGEEMEVSLEADLREETENYIFIEANKELNTSQERMRAAWLAK